MGKFINFGSGGKFNKNKVIKFDDFQYIGNMSNINNFGYVYVNSSAVYCLGTSPNGEAPLKIKINVDVGESLTLVGDRWVNSYGDNFKAECRLRFKDIDKGSIFFGVTYNTKFDVNNMYIFDTGIYIENGEIYPIEKAEKKESIGAVDTTESNEYDKYYTVKVLYDFNKSPQCDLYFIDYTRDILYHNSFDLTANDNLTHASIHAIARNTISDTDDDNSYVPSYLDYILIEKEQRR